VRKGGGTATQILGTELWNTESFHRAEPGRCAGPCSPACRTRFTRSSPRNTATRYGKAPYRLASLGYDSVLLINKVARNVEAGAVSSRSRRWSIRAGSPGLTGRSAFQHQRHRGARAGSAAGGGGQLRRGRPRRRAASRTKRQAATIGGQDGVEQEHALRRDAAGVALRPGEQAQPVSQQCAPASGMEQARRPARPKRRGQGGGVYDSFGQPQAHQQRLAGLFGDGERASSACRPSPRRATAASQFSGLRWRTGGQALPAAMGARADPGIIAVAPIGEVVAALFAPGRAWLETS
jgi:hypothetical protein